MIIEVHQATYREWLEWDERISRLGLTYLTDRVLSIEFDDTEILVPEDAKREFFLAAIKEGFTFKVIKL